MRRRLALLGAAGLLVLLPASLSPALLASESLVEAVVTDERGRPVSDVVVSLVRSDGAPAAPRPTQAVMDQQNKEFVPRVLAVSVGSPVTFPNRDNIRHHVYSFSSPKRFELPLYIGTPAAPVVFDKPGAVVLGCNIHDWMVGYIFVVPTPYFAKTSEDGRARVTELAPGTYEARVWHPRLRGEPEKTARPITLAAGEAGQLSFVVALKPERRGPQRPTYEGGSQS
jgi:plastocyanin